MSKAPNGSSMGDDKGVASIRAGDGPRPARLQRERFCREVAPVRALDRDREVDESPLEVPLEVPLESVPRPPGVPQGCRMPFAGETSVRVSGGWPAGPSAALEPRIAGGPPSNACCAPGAVAPEPEAPPSATGRGDGAGSPPVPLPEARAGRAGGFPAGWPAGGGGGGGSGSSGGGPGGGGGGAPAVGGPVGKMGIAGPPSAAGVLGCTSPPGGHAGCSL